MINRIWRNRGILFPIVAILVIIDLMLTLYFWDFEANPIVISMGQIWFAIVKIATLAILGYIWGKVRHADGLVDLVSKTLMASLAILYTGVLVINTAFLLS